MMPRASSTFNEQINKPRKDAFGNSIQKGSKNHRVSFIDKLDNKERPCWFNWIQGEWVYSTKEEN